MFYQQVLQVVLAINFKSDYQTYMYLVNIVYLKALATIGNFAQHNCSHTNLPVIVQLLRPICGQILLIFLD